MANKEGTTGKKRPPYSSKQQFLLVNVPLKPSNEAIINAVTQALKGREDIPFFQNRMGKKGVPPPYPDQQDTPRVGTETAALAASPSEDQESLLILINQEGYP